MRQGIRRHIQGGICHYRSKILACKQHQGVVSVLSEALKSCQLKSCARIEQLDNHSPTNRCVQTLYFVSGLRCHSRRKLLVHLSSCKTLSSLWQQVLQVVDRPSRKSIVQHILRIPGFLILLRSQGIYVVCAWLGVVCQWVIKKGPGNSPTRLIDCACTKIRRTMKDMAQ